METDLGGGRFKYVWKLLCRTWKENGHCMSSGSGRETLAYWANKTNRKNLPPWVYRSALNEAVRLGRAKKSVSGSGHTIFVLHT